MGATEDFGELERRARKARSEGDFSLAIESCIQAVNLLPEFLRERRQRTNIPLPDSGRAVLDLCDYLPVLRREQDLLRLFTAVKCERDIRSWCPRVQAAIDDCPLARRLYSAIAHQPGIAQTDLVAALGPRAKNLVYWAARLGTIQREKSGRNYRLYPAL